MHFSSLGHELLSAQPPATASSGGWTEVARCPACATARRRLRGEIPERYYMFGGERIALPDGAIRVYECVRCGLIFKSPLPTDALLTGVFARHAADKWIVAHDYGPELRRLENLTGGAAFDLLDVGAAAGTWLNACRRLGVGGRRSALDVVRYPGLETQLCGEFIHGEIDDPDPRWSGEPYDVVTAFDVLEHLHRAQTAFANLRAMVRPGGWLWLETGCVDSYWPNRFGVEQWWYVRLIEHHVFWSRRSLEAIAEAHGFALAQCEHARHKSWRDAGVGKIGSELLKIGLYRATGRHYAPLARRFGREGNQPWFPFTRDHLRAWFRRR
ncbi:MAG: class I SAM-dependent methyltransferase [Burkholderiales bacterium]